MHLIKDRALYKIDPSGVISNLYKSIPSQLAKGDRKFFISRATGERKTDSKEINYLNYWIQKQSFFVLHQISLSDEEHTSNL